MWDQKARGNIEDLKAVINTDIVIIQQLQKITPTKK